MNVNHAGTDGVFFWHCFKALLQSRYACHLPPGEKLSNATDGALATGRALWILCSEDQSEGMLCPELVETLLPSR